jgi:NRPS condensation-like uncharacterized protein
MPRAYRIRGERFPAFRLGVIEGHLSAAALVKKAHDFNATLGELLTALLICSIHEGMSLQDEERPVSVSIPVDLRRYFATPSTRNFFSVIMVSHNFSYQGRDFAAVLAQVKESFKAQLIKEKIHERLNQLASLENALPVKIVPLAVKVPVLKNAARNVENAGTASFSNLGRITMPEVLVPHIRLFGVFNSGKYPHMCICSFGDTLNISFASPLISSDMQRSFFRSLSSFGLELEIVSNIADPVGDHAGGSDALLS